MVIGAKEFRLRDDCKAESVGWTKDKGFQVAEVRKTRFLLVLGGDGEMVSGHVRGLCWIQFVVPFQAPRRFLWNALL